MGFHTWVRDFVEADFGHFSKMTFCKIQNLLKDLTKGLVFVKVRIRQAQIKKSANLLFFKSVTKMHFLSYSKVKIEN